MKITGGCYCGSLRYEAEGEAIAAFQCHCRECQYYSGGGANYALAIPGAGYRLVSGKPKAFSRSDLDKPATRIFCGTCGTTIASYYSDPSEAIFLKVGCFDEPGLFEPAMAVYTGEKQSFHQIPTTLPSFEKSPPQV